MLYNAPAIRNEIKVSRAHIAVNTLKNVRKTYISGANRESDQRYLKNELMLALIEEINDCELGRTFEVDMYLENLVSCLKKLRLK
jgi:hypothetical protein